MKISNESKVGIFAAITIVLMILGYNYLRGKDLFTKTHTYYVIYDDVEGINTSTPVLLNGMKVGQVTGLEAVEGSHSQVRVEMEVRKDADVKKSDSAKLFDNLLAGKSIKLMVSSKGEPAKDGDILVPAMEPSLMSNLSKTIVPIREKAESIMSSLDSLLGHDTRAKLDRTLTRIDQISKNIEELTEKNSIVMTRLNSILSNVDHLTLTLKNNTDKINHVIANLDKVADSLAQSNFKEVVARAAFSIAEVNKILEQINSGTGTVGALIYNEDLYKNLKNDAASLDALLKDLKENPRRYLHFSVFGGKDKSKSK